MLENYYSEVEIDYNSYSVSMSDSVIESRLSSIASTLNHLFTSEYILEIQMDIKQIVNKQSINYLKKIESIITSEVSERSALYYRQRITRSVNSANIKNNKPLISLSCEPKHCIKCLSSIKKWRIKAKTKTKRSKQRCNELVGSCLICGHSNKLDGLPKQVSHTIANKTVGESQRYSCSPKTPKLNQSWNKSTRNSAKSFKDSFITPNNSFECRSVTNTNSDKHKMILKNLLSNKKMKKADQKTGLSDFLQRCTQD